MRNKKEKVCIAVRAPSSLKKMLYDYCRSHGFFIQHVISGAIKEKLEKIDK